MNPQKIEKIFQIFSNLEPSPKTELKYTNEYTLLIAIVLSAQATDIGVNKATKNLFKIISTPQEILELGEEGLKDYIKSIGLYNSKAKNILALSKILIENHESKVPTTLIELQALPGVGRKTANVFLNCALGMATIAVDTHVFRVSNRIGLAKSKTPIETELQLLENIPQQWLFNAHHWLILHGRYICKARKPECYRCPVVEYCEYPNKNI